jgi:hypothetical protein
MADVPSSGGHSGDDYASAGSGYRQSREYKSRAQKNMYRDLGRANALGLDTTPSYGKNTARTSGSTDGAKVRMYSNIPNSSGGGPVVRSVRPELNVQSGERSSKPAPDTSNRGERVTKQDYHRHEGSDKSRQREEASKKKASERTKNYKGDDKKQD